MITVKHPDDECNQQQEALLAQLPPSQRRGMELMFIHGNISYQQKVSFVFTPLQASH
jgi:hypothetical protein